MNTTRYENARITRVRKGCYVVTILTDLGMTYTISRLRDARTFIDECASTNMANPLVFRALFNR